MKRYFFNVLKMTTLYIAISALLQFPAQGEQMKIENLLPGNSDIAKVSVILIPQNMRFRTVNLVNTSNIQIYGCRFESTDRGHIAALVDSIISTTKGWKDVADEHQSLSPREAIIIEANDRSTTTIDLPPNTYGHSELVGLVVREDGRGESKGKWMSFENSLIDRLVSWASRVGEGNGNATSCKYYAELLEESK